jgi:protease IV
MDTPRISFWRIFWPSLLAVVIASIFSILFFFLFLGITLSSLSSDFEAKELRVKDNSILHIKLTEPIADLPNSEFNPMSFNLENTIGLSDLLVGLEEAKKDSKIKGVFIELDELTCGYATTFELREAIEEFKSSGKFVVAYNSGEVITQKEYLLSSVADEVYAFPSSVMEFLGLGVEMMFFKKLFDKLDIEVQIIRGENNAFKSAVEPYFLDKMSDSSRVQVERYLASIWEDYLSAISTSRKIPTDELNQIAENASIRRMDDALKFKLIDGLHYQDEIHDLLKKKAGQDAAKELNLVDFSKYARKKSRQKNKLDEVKKPNIAVVFAEGGIATTGDGIASRKLVEDLREVRKNDKIKAVVLRVNSPGGSALASDEIWREVKLINEKKPVIVSMGDVAASGGYYISAAATRIFAQPSTITGSIGVFGMIPYTGKMFEEKIGLTFDRAQTNPHAVMSTNRKLTEEEFNVVQQEVNKIYEDFVQIVAKGRKLSVEQVDLVARGRVWTGKDALKIGLVDELGGLRKAMNYAVKKAGIDKPVYAHYPKQEDDKWMQIIEALSEEDENSELEEARGFTRQAFTIYKHLKEAEKMNGIQMRLPYFFELY